MTNTVLEAPGYFTSDVGLLVPKKALRESTAKGIQVAGGGYLHFSDTSLEHYVRQQLFQSRRKWFLFHEMYRRSVWVRACIDYTVQRMTRDEVRLVDRKSKRNPDIADLWDFLNEEAHSLLTFSDFLSIWGQSLKEYGQAYTYVERDRTPDRNPVHLWPLDPRVTFPVTDFHGTVMFHAQVYNGKAVAFMPEDVLYFFLPNNNSDSTSLSPLETIYESFLLEQHARRYNAALFENDLNVGMVFSMASADKDLVDENDRILKDKYTGAQNAGRHLILYGDAKLLRDGAMALKDVNFPELIHQCRLEACSVLGVPEALIGVPDNTNRATGQVYERQTYITTVRPLLKRILKQFNKQFVRGMWGSTAIEALEPVSSMLASPEEIEAASKISDIGVGTFNEYRIMVGLEEVANGDYPAMKIPGQGGFVRPDLTAFPGLMDEHYDFEAHEREHEAQAHSDAMNAQIGIVPSAPAMPYVPPMSYDRVQREPVGARIIDISRSSEWGDGYDWEVARRRPTQPGARGGSFYISENGNPRYGLPPKGKQPSPEAKGGGQSENTLTNPRDPDMPDRLSPEDQVRMAAARVQVTMLLREALDKNWTNEQFFSTMEKEGWTSVSGADRFSDVRDAKAAARVLADANPTQAYTIIGSDGQYRVMSKPLGGIDETFGGTEDTGRSMFGEWAQKVAALAAIDPIVRR